MADDYKWKRLVVKKSDGTSEDHSYHTGPGPGHFDNYSPSMPKSVTVKHNAAGQVILEKELRGGGKTTKVYQAGEVDEIIED